MENTHTEKTYEEELYGEVVDLCDTLTTNLDRTEEEFKAYKEYWNEH